MKFKHIIRQLWHGIYYSLAPESMQDYAMNCRDAVTELNTKKVIPFQVKLHLSLCQGCTNYDEYSKWLKVNFPEKNHGMPLDLSQKIFSKIKNHDT